MATIGEPPAAYDGRFVAPAPRPRPSPVLELQLATAIAGGRRRGRLDAVVTNAGTEPVEATLSVRSADGRVRGAVAPSVLALGPGEHRRAEIVLRARRPRLLRGETQHLATVTAREARSPVVVSRDVVFVQERLLALWAWALLVALVAAAAASATRMPDRVRVPVVAGAPDASSAARALTAAGLRLDPRLRSRTVDGPAPGTILDQIPAGGARADRGERVSLLVAVAARRSVTPVLDGMTPDRAASVLRAAGLTAGPVLPEGAPPAGVVASQLPAAGQRVPAGTAVTVFVRGRTPADPPAGSRPGGPRDAKVPPLQGRTVTAYARAVAASELVPRVVRAVDPAPAGTLVAVRPRPGTPLQAGARVRLIVAAGVPRLAFDTGAVVRLFDPRSGRTARQASPPQGKAVEPSWSADGRRLLYRVGRRLVLVSPRLADRGRVVYAGDAKYAAATFAPDASTNVLALVRRTGRDGDLCFARVGAGDLRPRCAADPRWDLGRQISWRRGGRELLVFGVRRGRPGTFGMLRYRSARPFSANPRDWRGELVTDASRRGRGVIAAAYSPSGGEVALVTNVGLPRFQVLVARPHDLRTPDARPLPVRARGSTRTSCPSGRHPSYQPLTYGGPKGVS
jgi:beta-lactam-binding protein with PASTA domain